MQNTLNIRQSLFINDSVHTHLRLNKTSTYNVDDKSVLEQNPLNKVIEGQVIKRGESYNFAQADEIFERAEFFRSLPPSSKQGLEAYTSIEKEVKREQIKAMMGIDLYA